MFEKFWILCLANFFEQNFTLNDFVLWTSSQTTDRPMTLNINFNNMVVKEVVFRFVNITAHYNKVLLSII